MSAETPYKLSITAFLRGRCLHTVQARKAGIAASGIGREQHQPGNIMNILARHGRALLCSTGFIVLGLLAACGGGDQGRDPILGLPTANVVSVTVTPATAALPVAGTVQLTAVANYADGSSHDVTTASAWTSATPAVASVSASGGLATGVSVGSSVLGASFGGQSGSATLTVNPAVLLSIALTPVAPSIAIGATQQFIVNGSYSDGSSRNVGALASYVSAT